MLSSIMVLNVYQCRNLQYIVHDCFNLSILQSCVKRVIDENKLTNAVFGDFCVVLISKYMIFSLLKRLGATRDSIRSNLSVVLWRVHIVINFNGVVYSIPNGVAWHAASQPIIAIPTRFLPLVLSLLVPFTPSMQTLSLSLKCTQYSALYSSFSAHAPHARHARQSLCFAHSNLFSYRDRQNILPVLNALFTIIA